MSDTAIKIINLHKKYEDEIYAVQGIDLLIKKGEFYGLLGPNGAGKSTTINAITSLVKPTKGNITVFNKDIVADFRYTRSKIGIAPQEISNDWFFSVEQLLYFQAGFYGIERKNDFSPTITSKLIFVIPLFIGFILINFPFHSGINFISLSIDNFMVT